MSAPAHISIADSAQTEADKMFVTLFEKYEGENFFETGYGKNVLKRLLLLLFGVALMVWFIIFLGEATPMVYYSSSLGIVIFILQIRNCIKGKNNRASLMRYIRKGHTMRRKNEWAATVLELLNKDWVLKDLSPEFVSLNYDYFKTAIPKPKYPGDDSFHYLFMEVSKKRKEGDRLSRLKAYLLRTKQGLISLITALSEFEPAVTEDWDDAISVCAQALHTISNCKAFNKLG